MNIYDIISETEFSQKLGPCIYPFDIDLYIKRRIQKYRKDNEYKYNSNHLRIKMNQFSYLLEKEKNIYIATAKQLMTKFAYHLSQNPFRFKITLISERYDFDQMSMYAIDNFIYVLQIYGWNVNKSNYTDIIKNDIHTYYIEMIISPSFAKL